MTRGWLWLLSVSLLAAPAPALAQQEDDAAEPVLDAVVEPAPPEVMEAWATPERTATRAADDLARESDSFARIHDADEALLELEAAQRMVGYDLLDGVR